MRRLVILITTALMAASCVNTSTEDTKSRYSDYQIVDENGKWVTYKIDETHFLCVPNYNADKGAVPVMLEVKKK